MATQTHTHTTTGNGVHIEYGRALYTELADIMASSFHIKPSIKIQLPAN